MTQIANVEGKIWIALLSRINQWTETPVMLPDTVFQPSANQSYLIVQDVGLESDTRAIQQSCGEAIEGTINVSVMVPIGWTWAAHKGMASRVADFLSNSPPMVYQDAVVRFTNRARVLGAPRLDQSWNRVEVQCAYRCWG